MKKWKFLFWVMCFLAVLNIIQLPFSAELDIGSFIGSFITAISLVSFYGFSYRVAVGSKLLAIVIFGINALSMLGFAIFSVLFLLTYLSAGTLFLFVTGMGMLWVYMYPLYVYAFKSEDIWIREKSDIANNSTTMP
ncbi:Uncharacterised protein [Vibrio owensii]|uniref:hypothetical protein n=1 Tax=Vibrio owensii TaxID=696485 RepID=UPI0005773C8C|nr:hypothetical protein [Vibrio owensii]SUQ01985.1 Uncharacterised protein [Vibrio owensii]